jgi:hypothetical protein
MAAAQGVVDSMIGTRRILRQNGADDSFDLSKRYNWIMATDTTQKRLLTVPEAAAELGVSPYWARTHLPVIRLGEGPKCAAMMRIERNAVERFIEERAQ